MAKVQKTYAKEFKENEKMLSSPKRFGRCL
jgi:hypothetical protein